VAMQIGSAHLTVFGINCSTFTPEGHPYNKGTFAGITMLLSSQSGTQRTTMLANNKCGRAQKLPRQPSCKYKWRK
jgi:hypothetical protein